MALLGVQELRYRVADPELCARFFRDFGLQLADHSDDHARFELPEGSSVSLSRDTGGALPEVIWGVDSEDSLTLVQRLLSKRPYRQDKDGTLRTRDPCGLDIGFRLFRRKPLAVVNSVENTLSVVRRWNQHREWFRCAQPKLIHHVVYGVPDVDGAVAFYQALGFRITDVAKGNGVFMRCDGRHDHHNLFLQRSAELTWRHVSFGVETIDELMIGANHMQRLQWSSDLGIGRHRISSTVYYYLNCPAGGMAEYSADTDYLTDEWKPKLWAPKFGNFHWVGRLPEALREEPEWDMQSLQEPIPPFSELSR